MHMNGLNREAVRASSRLPATKASAAGLPPDGGRTATNTRPSRIRAAGHRETSMPPGSMSLSVRTQPMITDTASSTKGPQRAARIAIGLS